MTALDWAAKIGEERGQELAESFLAAARKGDWRAADALMNRIYGKSEAAPVAHVPPNPAIDVIRAMSLEEKLELLGRLREGELVSTAPAPPTIEAVPPSASPTPPSAVVSSESQVPRRSRARRSVPRARRIELVARGHAQPGS